MKQTNRFLIYGATGYTGKLTARTAKEKGLEPILAGRNEVKLKALGEPLGFQSRAFDLSDKAKLDTALGEVDAVLHIAGPFSATSKPMADACLRTGTHYLSRVRLTSSRHWRHATRKQRKLASCYCREWASTWCRAIASAYI
jgi:short subunit dehydrogenase-like uncharacterized protein